MKYMRLFDFMEVYLNCKKLFVNILRRWDTEGSLPNTNPPGTVLILISDKFPPLSNPPFSHNPTKTWPSPCSSWTFSDPCGILTNIFVQLIRTSCIFPHLYVCIIYEDISFFIPLSVFLFLWYLHFCTFSFHVVCLVIWKIPIFNVVLSDGDAQACSNVPEL